MFSAFGQETRLHLQLLTLVQEHAGPAGDRCHGGRVHSGRGVICSRGAEDSARSLSLSPYYSRSSPFPHTRKGQHFTMILHNQNTPSNTRGNEKHNVPQGLFKQPSVASDLPVTPSSAERPQLRQERKHDALVKTLREFRGEMRTASQMSPSLIVRLFLLNCVVVAHATVKAHQMCE